MNTTERLELLDSRWDFSICDSVAIAFTTRRKAFSSVVINGMIYRFNFILPLLEILIKKATALGEGVNVINVACAF